MYSDDPAADYQEYLERAEEPVGFIRTTCALCNGIGCPGCENTGEALMSKDELE